MHLTRFIAQNNNLLPKRLYISNRSLKCKYFVNNKEKSDYEFFDIFKNGD